MQQTVLRWSTNRRITARNHTKFVIYKENSTLLNGTWYERNREKAISTARAWRLANPERYKLLQRESRRRKRAKTAIFQRLTRKGRLISPEQLTELYTKQEGCCRVCGKAQKESQLTANFSPNGAVRSLLCARCSVLADSIELYLTDEEIRARFERYFANFGSDSQKETGLPAPQNGA